MKRGFFNPKLYGEALRQLRTGGILLGVLSILSSVVIVAIQYFSMRDYISYGYYPSAPSALTATPALLAVLFLGGVAFIMKAFSFLHKRAASDYYHSLPDTRVCVAVSLTLAALTWLYAIIIGTVMITWAAYGITGMPFNGNLIPYLLLAYMAGVTLMAGAALIGVSVTGTTFSALVVTGLVLFLPRFIQLFFTQVMVGVAPIIYTGGLDFILNPSYNLPVGMVINAIKGSFGLGTGIKGVSEMLTFKGGIAYTAALGVAYLALGGLFLARRSSETADRSAPNRVLQHVFRCALTLPFLLFTALLIINTHQSYMLITAAILISLAVYFCYELFTTRKAINLITAAPVYLVLAALTTVLSLSAWAIGVRAMINIPEADDIASVNMDINERGYWYSDPGYDQILISRIDYTDPEIIAILAEGLEKTVECHRSGYRNSYSGISELIFRFHLKNGKTITRKITLTAENHQRLQDLKTQNPQYLECLRMLPSDDEILAVSTNGMTKKDARLIWESYRQEFNAITDGYSGESVEDGSYTVESTNWNSYASLTVSGSIGTEGFISIYSISDQTPQTANLYLELLNGTLRNRFREQFKYITSYDPATNENGYYSLTLELLSVPEAKKNSLSIQHSYSPEDPDRELKQELLGILTAALDYDGKAGQPVAEVSINTPLIGYFRQTMYLALTDEQASALSALVNEHGYIAHGENENGRPVPEATPVVMPTATPAPSPAAS